MSVEKLDSEVLRRVDRIETRVDNIERTLESMALKDEAHTATAYEVKALKKEVSQLKEEILVTIKDHTDRTWQLIQAGQKLIIALIIAILLIVGIKIGPDILGILGRVVVDVGSLCQFIQ